MKKIVSLLLGVVLLLGLCGCKPTDSAPTVNPGVWRPEIDSDFLVGFAEVDITPGNPVPLLGYGNSSERISDGVLSNLYAQCLAVRDKDGNTAIMISVDSAAVSMAETIAKKIASTLRIPAEAVIISAVHQHSTPDYSIDGDYYVQLVDGLVDVAKLAIEDLSPAEMYITSTETKYLTFVRNYILSDGSSYGDNYGTIGSGVTIDRHESEADNTMQLLKFVRGGYKKDVLVANFQGHPHIGNRPDMAQAAPNRTKVHADTIGVFRDELSAKLDCNVMYFSGAGGNLNMFSRIPKENRFTTMETHGKKLAEYAYEAEGTYTKVETGEVKVISETKPYHTDKTMEHLYSDALKVREIWDAQGIAAARNAIATTYTEFHSVYHANAVITKHKLANAESLNLYAISFGDVAFIGAPYEMFDTNGMEIKEGSPFKMTFITTQTNGCKGYIPSQLGYINGGYSTDITRFAPGSGEYFANAFVEMLMELKNPA